MLHRTFRLLLLIALLAPLSAAQAQKAADERLKSLMKKSKKKKPPASQLGDGKDADAATATAGASAPASALPSPQRDADEALLKALLHAFEPAPREVRVLAVEDLALLQDARVLNPLSHLIIDPDPLVAAAAVKSVGRYKHPRAEEILSNVVRHPQLAPALKIAAIRALPFQDSAASRELLSDVANSRAWAPPLKEAARSVISEMVPRSGAAHSPRQP